MGPLSYREGAAAVVVAATGIADNWLVRFGERRAVARVHGLAHAACMWRLGSGRQRYRGRVPQEREKQHELGGQATHS